VVKQPLAPFEASTSPFRIPQVATPSGHDSSSVTSVILADMLQAVEVTVPTAVMVSVLSVAQSLHIHVFAILAFAICSSRLSPQPHKVSPKAAQQNKTKFFGEKQLEYLSHFPSLCSFKSISARIFRVYGKGSRDIISRWVRSALRGEKIEVFLKENFFDYIFAGDVAEGLIRLAEKQGINGAVNLGTGRASQIQTAVKIIQSLIPGAKASFTKKEDLFEASAADMRRFTDSTGWKPEVTLEEGIRAIVEYEKESNR